LDPVYHAGNDAFFEETGEVVRRGEGFMGSRFYGNDIEEKFLMKHIPIIVSGATNQVGVFLLPRLTEAGFHIHALSRNDPTFENVVSAHLTWHRIDISKGWKGLDIQGALHLIHLAPVWLLPDIVDDLFHLGIRRIVALSSTSRFSKLNSENLHEREIAKRLAIVEEAFISKCHSFRISWTLLRPTLIYGCGMDRSVTIIARFIRRFGFFPLVGNGKGYRQPVHADDVAAACLAVLNRPVAFNRDYNLSGGQTITFREMVEALFLALDMKPRIVNIPLTLASFLIKGIAFVPAYRHLSKEMIKRVNQDMCFDSSDAQCDFGYSPRKFQYQGKG
jgi:nucleoside-diphosphate-sugar epimerase